MAQEGYEGPEIHIKPGQGQKVAHSPCGCAQCNPPTGFVHPDDPQVNPEGEDLLGDLEKNFTKIPCTLYTDGHGINFFVIDVDDKKYILNVRTD